MTKEEDMKGDEGERCPTCGGVGEVYWDWDDPEVEATVTAHAPCPRCGGSGLATSLPLGSRKE